VWRGSRSGCSSPPATEAGLRSRHPGASERELRCRLAALLYGRAAAERIFGPVPDDVPLGAIVDVVDVTLLVTLARARRDASAP
jgi:hypothetical protein